MKFTIEIIRPADGKGFLTRREWQGTEDAEPLFKMIAQRIEIAVNAALDGMSRTAASGTGKTQDEAQTNFEIDRDIRRAGEETNGQK